MANSRNSEKYYKIYIKERDKVQEKLSKLLKNAKPESLYEPCDYILQSGGKKLRPFLVLLSAKAAGGKFSQAYNAAMAVEIFHNFTLVHDDIMDNADVRRGRTTLHIRNDLSTAILAGDNLMGIAYKTLLKDAKENTHSIVSKFTKALIEVCEGQSYDTDFETQENVSINEYKVMIQKKTGALLELCCSIGAEIGGGTKEQIKTLENYGKNLGMAFQLQDDLLDLIAEQEKFGKQIGRDLIEGKKTFLFLTALGKAEGQDKEELEKVIKNKGIKKSQVSKYEKLYRKLGVIEETEKEVVKYTKLALKAAGKIENDEAKETMIWLANYLIKRNI